MRELLKKLEKKKSKRAADKKRGRTFDENLCMICNARGEDKRNLQISCFYDINEVVPEMLDLGENFFARICKACRGNLLSKLKDWRDERVALRDTPKDEDGNVEETDPKKNIPVRINGVIVMMTEEEFALMMR